MRQLLYLGNKGSELGGSVSAIELLSAKLGRYYRIHTYSGRKNQFARMYEMMAAILKHHKSVRFVLIDTYSTNAFWYAWICGMLCRCLRVPFIPVLHGGNLPDRLKNSPGTAKMLFGHAFMNVAPSGYLQAVFTENGYTTTLIPNFLALENYPFRQRKIIRPYLLWVRAFEQTYNPEMCVRLFAELKKEYPEAKLCMVGPDKDGSLETCRPLARALGIESDVLFTGRLSKEAWVALSVEYDLFVNTSNVDNSPVSVIEAMALGLLVVSTNVGGMPYLIHDHEEGLLSPVKDLHAMLANIKLLIGSPASCEKLRYNARQKAEKFDWKAVEQQWLQLLK